MTVAERLPNGNLLVRGQKSLTLNQGEEFIRLEGIVRPVDIGPQNTVASTKLAMPRSPIAVRARWPTATGRAG